MIGSSGSSNVSNNACGLSATSQHRTVDPVESKSRASQDISGALGLFFAKCRQRGIHPSGEPVLCVELTLAVSDENKPSHVALSYVGNWGWRLGTAHTYHHVASRRWRWSSPYAPWYGANDSCRALRPAGAFSFWRRCATVPRSRLNHRRVRDGWAHSGRRNRALHGLAWQC